MAPAAGAPTITGTNQPMGRAVVASQRQAAVNLSRSTAAPAPPTIIGANRTMEGKALRQAEFDKMLQNSDVFSATLTAMADAVSENLVAITRELLRAGALSPNEAKWAAAQAAELATGWPEGSITRLMTEWLAEFVAADASAFEAHEMHAVDRPLVRKAEARPPAPSLEHLRKPGPEWRNLLVRILQEGVVDPTRYDLVRVVPPENDNRPPPKRRR